MATYNFSPEDRAYFIRSMIEAGEKTWGALPPGCPEPIRSRIVSERARRLGFPDYIRALLTEPASPAKTAPTPAPRAADPEMESLAGQAQLLARL